MHISIAEVTVADLIQVGFGPQDGFGAAFDQAKVLAIAFQLCRKRRMVKVTTEKNSFYLEPRNMSAKKSADGYWQRAEIIQEYERKQEEYLARLGIFLSL